MKPLVPLALLSALLSGAPVARAQDRPRMDGGTEATSVEEPTQQELDAKVRRLLHAPQTEREPAAPGREELRRRILEKVDRRIAEAMERLRAEIREIVEAEIGAAALAASPTEEPAARARVPAPPLERLAPARPWLGVELEGGEGEESVTIARVLPGSPAEKAGLRAGDRILSLLGVPVADRDDLGGVLWTRAPGETVEARVSREGREIAAEVVLGERPQIAEAEVAMEGGAEPDEDDAAVRALAAEARARAAADDPKGTKVTFDDLPAGEAPKGWSFARTGEGPEGKWSVERDGENGVLKQSSPDPTDFRYPIAVLDGKEFSDFVLTARFEALSGEVDQAGGLVFRYRDAGNYAICRANALEGNFRLYVVAGGKRKQLRSQNVKVTAKEWHRLRVEAKGKEIRCSLDGGEPLVAEIEGMEAGKVGVWTKADSVTLFDDLEVVPRD